MIEGREVLISFNSNLLAGFVLLVVESGPIALGANAFVTPHTFTLTAHLELVRHNLLLHHLLAHHRVLHTWLLHHITVNRYQNEYLK